MSTDTLEHPLDQSPGKDAGVTEKAQKALADAVASAQQAISDSARAAERALRDSAEKLLIQTKPLRESAGRQADEAQRYVFGRVRERPVTAALAGLGAGLILGLMLSNRKK
jgi:ElaB/YqjD/DUF883 family membrane-anchored ribosome-binding protein